MIALQLAMSALTILTMWLAGDKKQLAWIIGLGNQTLWLAFIVLSASWGLFPMWAAIVVTYARNLLKWRREARTEYLYNTCGGETQVFRRRIGEAEWDFVGTGQPQ